MRIRAAFFSTVLVALSACSPSSEGGRESDGTSDSEVIASVPDCKGFDLKAMIDRTHDASPDYQCTVSSGLSRSSQPSDGWIKSLSDPSIREVPFKSVVNLRGENGANGEDPVVRGSGMTPLNIRVKDMTAPTRDQIVAFLSFVTDPQNAPALVHCKAGQGRTGTFVASYRMVVQGWDPKDAIAEARSFNVNDQQAAFLATLATELDAPDLKALRGAAGSDVASPK